MSLQNIQNQSVRRAILKLLAQAADHSSVDYDLQKAVEIAEGLKPSFENFSNQLAWLESKGLVLLEGALINNVIITQQGLDVAEYKIEFGGIAKKRPER